MKKNPSPSNIDMVEFLLRSVREPIYCRTRGNIHLDVLACTSTPSSQTCGPHFALKPFAQPVQA